MIKKIGFIIFLIVFLACTQDDTIEVCDNAPSIEHLKINGGSILQTWTLTGSEPVTVTIKQATNVNWVALSPVVEIYSSRPYYFRVSNEIEKMKIIISKIIQSGNNNITLKPLTSFEAIKKNTFWGDFYVKTEVEWQEIENTYDKLFYEFAKLSEIFPEVKLLSIGNELKEFTKRRPHFFESLISKIRTDFPHLKLTYAANWDEYEQISFWDDLDYIGVNSYFPLIKKNTPSVQEFKKALGPIKEKLKFFSCRFNKPILFTEYGFRSIDFGAWKTWELDDIINKNENYKVQENGYTSFYEVFWNEPWVAGGFFWEWSTYPDTGTFYTPKNNGWYVNKKPVEMVIKKWYSI